MLSQTIYLVRHAESTLKGRYCGSTDAGLSKTGIQQAKKLGKFFHSIPLDLCIHSDLKRTRQTAEPIYAKKSIPVRESPAIRELHFGKWERLKFSSIERRWPEIYSRWMRAPHAVQIPDGESFSQLCERINRFVQELKGCSERNAVIVAHGGSLSVLTMQLLKKPLSQFWQWLPPNASISILKRNLNHSSSEFKAIRLKDTSHL